jgi:predicted HTH domain antitoxin
METKKVRLTDDIVKGVSYTAKMEGVDESSALSKLLKLGVMWYSTNLYKLGKITLAEAAELSNVSLRKMMDILEEQGIKGNVTLKQQMKALDHARKL